MRQRLNQRSSRLVLGLFACAFLAGTLATPPVSNATARSPKPTTPRPAASGTAIPCNDSPFGRRLTLGQENEVFIGYRDVDFGVPGSLSSYIYDQDPGDGSLRQKGFTNDGNSAAGRDNISSLAGVAADLDGDGKAEFVQGFTDRNGGYQITVVKDGSPLLSRVENWPNQTSRAMAAGDILGLDDGSQQVVIASRANDGVLNVAVYGWNATTGVGAPLAVWRSNTNNRGNASLIQVAVGNLDGDRYSDIAVGLLQSNNRDFQIITLEYQPNYQAGSGANTAQNMQERAFVTRGATTSGLKQLQIAVANITGGSTDRIIIGYMPKGFLVLNGPITLMQYGYSPSVGLQYYNQLTVPANSLNFAMAAGDVLGEYRDQIVLMYDIEGNSTYGSLNVNVIKLFGADTNAPYFSSVDLWSNNANGRDKTDYLALAVGDFNKDNRDEAMLVFKDTNPLGSQTVYLAEKLGPNKEPLGLELKYWARQDPTLSAAPTVAVGDWDNDSLRARPEGQCERVVDNVITSVNFVPPFWQKIQGGQQKGGSIGLATSQATAAERSITYKRGETVSAYVGVEAGASLFDVVEFSASAKATGSRGYSMSNRQTTGTSTETVTTVGRSWFDDALVYEPAEYNCYTYQLSENGTDIPADKAKLRFCEYQALPGSKPPIKASELDSWDANSKAEPEYAPAIRDWSSLALFRGAFASQSSNGATAGNAVNSEIANGSFVAGAPAQTNTEANPWWQIDLGTVQPIGKIRLWTPPASLANFYVFVSNTPFNTTDPNALLLQAGVRSYSLADLGYGLNTTDTAPSVTTFVTTDATANPVNGRYVRVQRVGTSALTLSEVQVFGINHVNPDRYPLDMRDTNAGDGMFEVKLYNPNAKPTDSSYEWVKVRGNLLWDGRANAALNGLSADRGNAIIDWSLGTSNITTTVQAKEIENTTSVGAEFELAGGAGVKVLTGGGYERTSGVASEVVQSTSWGSAFNMGGSVQGFPAGYNGLGWATNCDYRFQPYYYELTETTNIGYRQRFPVLDYLVPDNGFSFDLNRTNADLPFCRNGNPVSATPQTSNDTAQARYNQTTKLSVLANDLGNDLKITSISNPSNGTATFTDREIIYTPAPGYFGQDSITYTIGQAQAPQTRSSSNASTTATVTITVAGSGVGKSLYVPLSRR